MLRDGVGLRDGRAEVRCDGLEAAARSPQLRIAALLGRGEGSHGVCVLARANGGSEFLVARLRLAGLMNSWGREETGLGGGSIAWASRGCAVGCR